AVEEGTAPSLRQHVHPKSSCSRNRTAHFRTKTEQASQKGSGMQIDRRRMISAVAALLSAGASTAAIAEAAKTVTTASGLQITDVKVGTGATPRTGQTCVMHYTGWLYENGAKGKKFDSSVDRNEPFEFPIGQKRVIAGWDEGVATMKVGGKRILI